MSKWHSFLEYLQFPLKVLFLATVLLGLGTLMINPYIGLLDIFTSPIYTNISDILRYLGAFLIKLFPLLVFLKLLTRKYEDSAPVFVGFVSLIVIFFTNKYNYINLLIYLQYYSNYSPNLGNSFFYSAIFRCDA